jgi:predicted ATPase
MNIISLHIRHFRSIESAALTHCGGLNVLIGKNNAGKSNILSAIDVALAHLRRGHVAGRWESNRRAVDEFTDRDVSRRMQIGIEFEFTEQINSSLRDALLQATTQFERAIDQVRHQRVLSFIVSGAVEKNAPYLFVEAIAAGRLVTDDQELSVSGIRLLHVPTMAGADLFTNVREASEFRSELAALEKLDSDNPTLDYALRNREMSPGSYALNRIVGDALRPGTQRELDIALKSAVDADQFLRGVATIIAGIKNKIDEIERRETSTPLSAFAGDVRVPPEYAGWLMKEFGAISVLHFKETKQPIGPDEAAALLGLKVRRGGEERLSAVKQTVRALLGVSVDAFEPEESLGERRPVIQRPGRRIAEMDINDFVVEANGAGIREALRMVLDLELKNPDLVLIEEPEVHLHPGLEQALHSYLVGKSNEVQMFLTTHSTSFVDAASLQNVYLVSRDVNRKTIIETVVPEDGAFRIPSELGLRLSTVFMYDRLVFVEGRSDEDVLRQLAKQLRLDLTQANVGFVQMGGVRNFAHFAAEGTLELLSRRRIQMWFVTDRDENTDDDVHRMLGRLGDRARLAVLEKRELENYLLNPKAVAEFLVEKTQNSESPVTPTEEEVASALEEEATSLKEVVARLRFDKEFLRPIYLQSRTATGSPEARIEAAREELESRLRNADAIKSGITSKMDADWPQNALNLAPGATVLDNTAKRYGVRYVKEVDGLRLARKIHSSAISSDLRRLLTEIAGPSGFE